MIGLAMNDSKQTFFMKKNNTESVGLREFKPTNTLLKFCFIYSRTMLRTIIAFLIGILKYFDN